MTLGIYGIGGLGRDVYLLASRIDRDTHRWEDILFIEDYKEVRELYGRRVIRSGELPGEKGELEIAIGIGEPSVRERLYGRMKAEGVRAATLVDPTVALNETVGLGEGAILFNNVYVGSNVRIGDDACILPNASIGHDSVVGAHSVIGANSSVSGANRIGRGVYMGFLSGTKENLRIGDGAICSAGAIVFRDLPDEVIAVGNPARIMKRNEDKRVFAASRDWAEG